MPSRKKKDPNTANLHRETQLKVETNINGVIHDDPHEVNRIFYKMNAQSDYDPRVDMQPLGLAGNAASRQRLREDKKQTKPAKPVNKSGQPTVDHKLNEAIKKDNLKKGIN